jgi:hypothetical protein
MPMPEELITGYQFMEDGTYAGVYKFPKNKDQQYYTHMPPFTTLVPPPDAPAGKVAKWNGASWGLVNLPLPQWLVDFDFPPPNRLELPYIQRMKNAGVYLRFIQAYFDRGLITENTEAAFDALVQAGVDSRAADHALALTMIYPRTLPITPPANPVPPTPAIYPVPMPP